MLKWTQFNVIQHNKRPRANNELWSKILFGRKILVSYNIKYIHIITRLKIWFKINIIFPSPAQGVGYIGPLL